MARSRRRNSSRRTSRDSGKKLIGILLIFAVTGVLIGLGVLRPDPETRDELGCLIDQSPPTLLSVLIDSTDTINERTARQAQIEIKKEILALQDNSRVELYQISPDGGHISALFKGCKPPTGKNADALTQNAQLMKSKFEEYASVFDQALHSLLKQSPADQSPIIESIQSVAIEMSSVDSESKRIVVISDLIQHSKRLSFYRQSPAISDYENTQKKVGGGFADLRGTSIRFMVIPRALPNGSKSDLKRFWMDWIRRGDVEKSRSSIEDLS